jgi:hypothetical protein
MLLWMLAINLIVRAKILTRVPVRATSLIQTCCEPCSGEFRGSVFAPEP